jgi:site-specific DNA-methyltransferase (adenine-specific)
MKLILGDCREIVPMLDVTIDAVATDPPYGCKNDCDYTRFTGGLSPSRDFHAGIQGDDQPFDPSPWLAYPKVALFGFQFFASRLPLGTVLVWNKKRPKQLGTFLSDCELAWLKGGKGCYLFNHVWHGFDRESERGKTLHPTQKPVAVWKWILGRMKLKPGATVLDPYMGCGSCGVACQELDLRYVGVEIEPRYFDVAVSRFE